MSRNSMEVIGFGRLSELEFAENTDNGNNNA